MKPNKYVLKELKNVKILNEELDGGLKKLNSLFSLLESVGATDINRLNGEEGTFIYTIEYSSFTPSSLIVAAQKGQGWQFTKPDGSIVNFERYITEKTKEFLLEMERREEETKKYRALDEQEKNSLSTLKFDIQEIKNSFIKINIISSAINDIKKSELEKFEHMALMLYPKKRKEIDDAIINLKLAEKELKTAEKNPNYKDPQNQHIETKGDAEKNYTEVGKAKASVGIAKGALQGYLDELQALKNDLDKDKPINQTRIQKIKSYLKNLFQITGDTSLNLEIQKIERALDDQPKNLFVQLVNSFIKAIDCVAKFIANKALDIKASIRNTEESGEKYKDTWVPNRFRKK